MLQRITLLSTEKIMAQLLSQDDYNYNQFNNELLNLDLPIDNSVQNMSFDSNSEGESRGGPRGEENTSPIKPSH